ncbi:MAG: tetratricopeptide repeat protein, partial [Ardenticatenaceae bacterium]
ARVAVLLALVVLLLIATPFVLWAYNVERAGQLMERGLAWAEPRYVDTLPVAHDRGALEDALGHLAAAMRWRPDHEYPYRLAGQIYTARGEWLQAAESYEQARLRAPDNPLLAWEAGLVYEQMIEIVEQGERRPIVTELAAGQVIAPDVPISTPFCTSEPGSCYVAETTFALPYASESNGPTLTTPTLFMHPPARVRQQLSVPADLPALTFLLGLHPAAHGWGSDGASFQIWVEAAGQPGRLIYERTLDAATDVQGWVAGGADLSPWAGQSVTLVIGAAPGPTGDAAGDWYGVGDVAFTSLEAAHYISFTPQVGLRESWRSGGFAPSDLLARGDRARFRQRYDESLVWYERAGRMDLLESTVWYYRYRTYKAQGQTEMAVNALQRAVRSNKGWISTEAQARAHLLWGIELFNQEQHEQATQAFLKTLVLGTGDPAVHAVASESYRFLGAIHWRRGELAEAHQN